MSSDEIVYASTGMRDSMASMRMPSASPGGASDFAQASRRTFTVTVSHSTPFFFPSSNASSARSTRPSRPHARITDARLALSGGGILRSSMCRQSVSAVLNSPSFEHAASTMLAHMVLGTRPLCSCAMFMTPIRTAAGSVTDMILSAVASASTSRGTLSSHADRNVRTAASTSPASANTLIVLVNVRSL